MTLESTHFSNGSIKPFHWLQLIFRKIFALSHISRTITNTAEHQYDWEAFPFCSAGEKIWKEDKLEKNIWNEGLYGEYIPWIDFFLLNNGKNGKTLRGIFCNKYIWFILFIIEIQLSVRVMHWYLIINNVKSFNNAIVNTIKKLSYSCNSKNNQFI